MPDEQIRPCEKIEGVQMFKARNHHLFKVSSPMYRCWQAGIIEWLKVWDPDVLIVEANPRYPSTPKAIAWMHAHKRPVLGWGLGAPPLYGTFSGLRASARRRLLHSLDAVIAYSDRGAQEYLEFGMPSEHIFTAYNAVVPRPQYPLPLRSAQFDGCPKVLFVGRLQDRKRLDLLFQACASLPESNQPDLWIVGDGPARNDFQFAAERSYPKTEFFGGLYGKDLEDRFLKADLFVLPGTGGLAIQQAMSYGLPVIAAQGDGTQEDLVRRENGWNVIPGDPSSLRSALEEALADPGQLRRLGAESYRIVVEQVNLECMKGSFIAAINSIYHPKC
jgi:glycosyltransferase involved in cell wall biosynthesis